MTRPQFECVAVLSRKILLKNINLLTKIGMYFGQIGSLLEDEEDYTVGFGSGSGNTTLRRSAAYALAQFSKTF